jgi:hypothetical protein
MSGVEVNSKLTSPWGNGSIVNEKGTDRVTGMMMGKLPESRELRVVSMVCEDELERGFFL